MTERFPCSAKARFSTGHGFANPLRAGIVRRMDDTSKAASDARRELVALMARVAQSDRPALAELYRRTSAKLYGIIARILPDEPDAAEVLQDVYVSVWRHAGRFEADRASPISWLAVMARNRAIDRRRRRTVPTDPIDEAFDIASPDPSPFAQALAAEQRHQLSDCLAELDPAHAGYIRAAFLGGDSYSEIADREGAPLGTMKSWIRRALLRLRECLER
jgi:RNA polymerase sigma-70 factor (ECF subfamily)